MKSELPTGARLLLKGARIGAAIVLPAVLVFGVAADEPGGTDFSWVLYLVPVAWFVVIAVGWLDSRRTMILAAVCSGLIVAVAAYVERDDRPIPICEGLMDFGCKLDARPIVGLLAVAWVLVGGVVGVLIAAAWRTPHISNDASPR